MNLIATKAIQYHKILVTGVAFALLLSGPLSAEDKTNPADTTQQPSYLNTAWWNQSRMTEKLALGKTERTQFDQLAITYVDQRKQLMESATTLQVDYREALNSGKSDEASKISHSMADIGRELAVSKRQLKIDVVAQLEQEQRELLVNEFPQVLQRTWFKQKKARGKK